MSLAWHDMSSHPQHTRQQKIIVLAQENEHDENKKKVRRHSFLLSFVFFPHLLQLYQLSSVIHTPETAI